MPEAEVTMPEGPEGPEGVEPEAWEEGLPDRPILEVEVEDRIMIHCLAGLGVAGRCLLPLLVKYCPQLVQLPSASPRSSGQLRLCQRLLCIMESYIVYTLSIAAARLSARRRLPRGR